HDSRRIDNQLRGRSGRQGDAGSSRFYLSMEDTLMRIFGDPDRTKNMLTKVGMREGESIESALLTRQIERAQRKVEAHNFDARKSLLEFDDVANDQRTVIYKQRNELLEADDLGDAIAGIREEVLNELVSGYLGPDTAPPDEWDIDGLENILRQEFGEQLQLKEYVADLKTPDEASLRQYIVEQLVAAYEEKSAVVGPSVMRQFEKVVMLSQLDSHWKDHLAAMDYLRQGIHLRGYAQKNPKQEYKREAFEMFSEMLEQVKHSVTSIVSRARVRTEADIAAMDAQRAAAAQMQYQHAEAQTFANPAGETPEEEVEPSAAELEGDEPFVRDEPKIGRNDPCPCGSGKKFKKCHGELL
ncbi:MAG: SEC-C metal-binding domain-containing protein, partial [Gammaproteobacteria bacterium]|nr:SEC-C metal-binding domain-containing protein [Gammaproteobacteria bacterium]